VAATLLYEVLGDESLLNLLVEDGNLVFPEDLVPVVEIPPLRGVDPFDDGRGFGGGLRRGILREGRTDGADPGHSRPDGQGREKVLGF